MLLWTLKEAYVKALGRGIAGTPFRTFSLLQGGVPPAARAWCCGAGGGGGGDAVTNAKDALMRFEVRPLVSADAAADASADASADAAMTMHRVAPRGAAAGPGGGVDDGAAADAAQQQPGPPLVSPAGAATSAPLPRWRLAVLELGSRHLVAVCAEQPGGCGSAAESEEAGREGREGRLRVLRVAPLARADEEVGLWGFFAALEAAEHQR